MLTTAMMQSPVQTAFEILERSDRLRPQHLREETMGSGEYDRRQVSIMATRQMAVETWTEELLALLVDTGTVSAERAAVMLDGLQAKLWDQSSGEYLLDPQTIEMESTRVAGLAKAYRARHQDRG
jgi:hypothetical protein